jgi:hypothetical protein
MQAPNTWPTKFKNAGWGGGSAVGKIDKITNSEMMYFENVFNLEN